MAFSVRDFHDLVQLLEQHPEWRAELRRLVLSEDILNLPAVVHELAEAQRRTEQRIEELAEAQRRTEQRLEVLAGRIEELAEAQQRTEYTLQVLTGRVDRLGARFNGMRGMLLELIYERRAGAYFGRMLRRVRVVGSDELDDLLDAGLASGALDEDSAHDVRLADLIVRGRRPEQDREIYLVVEISAVVDPSDVERAARRAALLGRVRPAQAVVAGERIVPEAQRMAERDGVLVVASGRAEAAAGE